MLFIPLFIVGVAVLLADRINSTVHSLLVFAWECFVKPLLKKKRTTGAAQQDSLELFYKNQAHIYDTTREFLLKGRRECLRLAVGHLSVKKDLVWIDIGGGTGANIEYMDQIHSISNFKAVYLVDLSTSLCEVARERCAARGWTNVHIVVADACNFEIDEESADLITYSYSLSMIPTFNSAVDHAASMLNKSHGIIASVDFGIQSLETSIGRVNTVGGLVNRNIPWILRNFWRIWFEADRVFLDSARRNYLEYRFGTVKSLNDSNNKLGRIPYYIWIGCDKSKANSLLHKINCLATESPYLAPQKQQQLDADTPISKGHEAALSNSSKNLPYPSIYYQRENWRVFYDELNPMFEQFKNQYIYAFTWEDPREDHNILKFTSEDTVLAITSAGDNILSYASLPNPPRRIHAVDLNPCQGHLLELKLACFKCLDHETVWRIFGEGKIENFTELLIDKLSPHMSSQGFQYWMDRGDRTFSKKGLYDTGSTRWALRLARLVFKFFGVAGHVERLCHASSMEEQLDIWTQHLKPALFNPVVATLMVGNPIFLWKALGVPANQAKMMGRSVLQYVIDTLDPLLERSLISKDNYFYYLCLMGHYSIDNCPDYLTLKGYNRLTSKKASPIDNVRLHTDTLNDVFSRLSNKAITIAIIMDHMDWFDPNGKDAINEITALSHCLADGGRVMLRSASTDPWYIKTFESLGFTCQAAAVRTADESIDRVNMYASTWVCTKTRNIETSDVAEEIGNIVPETGFRRRMSSLQI